MDGEAYDPSKRNADDSDSDWEVEKFDGTPQEYLEMLEKRKTGCVSEVGYASFILSMC